MNTSTTPGSEPAALARLYGLLPTVHRMRDAERGYPLKALVAVIAEQAQVLEDDLDRLYDNSFIETAQDWAVPYLGDLVGYEPVADAGLPADQPGCDHPRALVPRREVANLIRNRRRKGTLALLEQLALDVAQWPARAVEFYTLLARHQQINHLYPQRHRVVDLREMDVLDRLDGPFDASAHTVDVRRMGSRHGAGRYGIPNVGVFVWRLLSLPVGETPACCVEESGPHCFSFSVLGQDAPLFVAPQPETDPSHIADELNLPAAVRRLAFDEQPEAFYGEGLSLAVRADGWAGVPGNVPGGALVPLAQVRPADLSGWAYVPPAGFIAIDPVLGRIAFPPNQLPKRGVRVSYRYGFPARIGGGEYARPLSQPSGEVTVYTVGEGDAYRHHRIADALARWREEQPRNAVIELATSGVFVEPLNITLADGQGLQLRAAQRVRPVLRLIDWQTDLPDALTVSLGAGSRIVFDGLMVTGRPVRIQSRPVDDGPVSIANEGDEAVKASFSADPACASQVVIRHCTLVPGWAIDCGCSPRRPAEPSLELNNVRARVRVEHSIVGALQVSEDAVRLDPVTITIDNSIVDATSAGKQAIGAPGDGIAHAVLTVRNTTVFGIVDVHAMQLGENSLFTGCVNVARRQIGCLRYSYVPAGCRTPRRYHCQPDGVIAEVKARLTDPLQQATAIASELLRVKPQFNAQRYGKPAYAQLADGCADEIKRGADDEAEMGVYHDLFQPQREANLRARLAEYSPAGMDVGPIFAN